MKAKNSAYLLLVLLIMQGCGLGSKFTESVDQLAFKIFSDTIFEKPKIVGFREVHLSQDFFSGRLVKVSGVVIDKGDLGTYITLGEKDDRLIIAITDLVPTYWQGIAVGQAVSALGIVEVGKKGMPFLRAHSLKLN